MRDEQLPRICNAICLRSGLAARGACFEGPGDGVPTEAARQFFEGRRGCSTGERLLLGVAFALHNHRNTVTLGDLLRVLDGPNLVMVGELLAALGRGDVAIELWLATHEEASR